MEALHHTVLCEAMLRRTWGSGGGLIRLVSVGDAIVGATLKPAGRENEEQRRKDRVARMMEKSQQSGKTARTTE